MKPALKPPIQSSSDDNEDHNDVKQHMTATKVIDQQQLKNIPLNDINDVKKTENQDKRAKCISDDVQTDKACDSFSTVIYTNNEKEQYTDTKPQEPIHNMQQLLDQGDVSEATLRKEKQLSNPGLDFSTKDDRSWKEQSIQLSKLPGYYKQLSKIRLTGTFH